MTDKIIMFVQLFFGLLFVVMMLLYSAFILFGKVAVRSPLYRRVFCEGMGWHRPNGLVGFDGCSNTSQCITCGKPVLQDSQGNWFTTSR